MIVRKASLGGDRYYRFRNETIVANANVECWHTPFIGLQRTGKRLSRLSQANPVAFFA